MPNTVSHIVTLGLGFGDEGKGGIVDYLVRTRDIRLIVRFNGGAQASHNVTLPDGRHHAFSQFGSGTYREDVKTFLSAHHLFDPVAFRMEASDLAAQGLRDVHQRVYVDNDAVVVTPYHVLAGRLREHTRIVNNHERHGSCGMGVWEAQRDADACLSLCAAELWGPREALACKLLAIRELKRAQLAADGICVAALTDHDERELSCSARAFNDAATRETWLARVVEARTSTPWNTATSTELSQMLNTQSAVFEGAQGVLLDPAAGFHPFVTGTCTTGWQALQLLHAAGQIATWLGVLRTYATRHGPGPMVTEGQLPDAPRDLHNAYGFWQGAFRTGCLDLVTLRYAQRCAWRLDELALTCVDQMVPAWPVCRSYMTDAGETVKDIPWPVCRSYMTAAGETVKDIPRMGKLAERQLLTRALTTCRPVVTLVPAADVLSEIENAARCRLKIVSRGPTHEYKEEGGHDESLLADSG